MEKFKGALKLEERKTLGHSVSVGIASASKLIHARILLLPMRVPLDRGEPMRRSSRPLVLYPRPSSVSASGTGTESPGEILDDGQPYCLLCQFCPGFLPAVSTTTCRAVGHSSRNPIRVNGRRWFGDNHSHRRAMPCPRRTSTGPAS